MCFNRACTNHSINDHRKLKLVVPVSNSLAREFSYMWRLVARLWESHVLSAPTPTHPQLQYSSVTISPQWLATIVLLTAKAIRDGQLWRFRVCFRWRFRWRFTSLIWTAEAPKKRSAPEASKRLWRRFDKVKRLHFFLHLLYQIKSEFVIIL